MVGVPACDHRRGLRTGPKMTIIGIEKPRRRVGKDRQSNRACGESTGHSVHPKESVQKYTREMNKEPSYVQTKQLNLYVTLEKLFPVQNTSFSLK